MADSKNFTLSPLKLWGRMDGTQFSSSQMWHHFLTQTKHYAPKCNPKIEHWTHSLDTLSSLKAGKLENVVDCNKFEFSRK